MLSVHRNSKNSITQHLLKNTDIRNVYKDIDKTNRTNFRHSLNLIGNKDAVLSMNGTGKITGDQAIKFKDAMFNNEGKTIDFSNLISELDVTFLVITKDEDNGTCDISQETLSSEIPSFTLDSQPFPWSSVTYEELVNSEFQHKEHLFNAVFGNKINDLDQMKRMYPKSTEESVSNAVNSDYYSDQFYTGQHHPDVYVWMKKEYPEHFNTLFNYWLGPIFNSAAENYNKELLNWIVEEFPNSVDKAFQYNDYNAFKVASLHKNIYHRPNNLNYEKIIKNLLLLDSMKKHFEPLIRARFATTLNKEFFEDRDGDLLRDNEGAQRWLKANFSDLLK